MQPDVHTDLEREIKAEQGYVTALYAHLDGLRERAAADLQRVRRAPLVPTPSGRGERDAFDAWHTERIGQLSAVEDRLCFGRLDLIDGHRRYVGRIGLSDDDRRQLLLDWRAPAAASFYQATAAAPDGVMRRRHIATKGRVVTSLDDEVLDAEALDAAADADPDLGAVAGEGALMSALTARRTGRMRDIVATLQSEQDRIVRAPLPGVLVVQGGPGTGKTAVALHRAAFLLYTHRTRIARSGVLIVGPSPVFLRYIEQVLPSLGETGVVLTTVGELYPGIDARAVDAPHVCVVKGDLRMAAVVRNAVRLRQKLINTSIQLRLDGDAISLRPRAVATARGRARSTGKPHNDARVTFVTHLLDDLADQLAKARGQDIDDEHTRAELLTDLRSSVDVRREINLRWMPLTPQKLLTDLFASPARLAEAAAGVLDDREQALLLRERGAPWTIADVPLLDEAAELIGADVAVSVTQATSAARERRESLEYARGVLEMAGDAASMMTAEMLADRFADSTASRTLAERAGADRSWVFGHAVVDEAQELSPMQWRLLVRRVPSRSMTVVGDVAQTGSAAGATAWADVLDEQAKDRWRVEELTVNYRTPARIMGPATAVLEAAGIKVSPPTAARDGDWDPITELLPAVPADGSIQAIMARVVAAIRADEAALTSGRYAAVAPRAVHAQVLAAVTSALAGESLAERVSVHTVDEVKGLEFDGVVVLDPAAIVAESPRGVNDLYVALTRPTQRLTLLHHGDLPQGLA